MLPVAPPRVVVDDVIAVVVVASVDASVVVNELPFI